ncbi:MAG: RICIN domain-containing protein [Bacillota bacterium]
MKKNHLFTILLVILVLAPVGCEDLKKDSSTSGQLYTEVRISEIEDKGKVWLNVKNSELEENHSESGSPKNDIEKVFADLEAGNWQVEVWLQDQQGIYHKITHKEVEIVPETTTEARLNIDNQDFKETLKDNNYDGLNLTGEDDSGTTQDVESGSTEDGANVSQWEYQQGANQHWSISDTGGGQFQIRNVNSDKALEVYDAGTEDGDNVQQYSYTGHDCQHWEIAHVGSGYYSLINVNSGKSLDVADFSSDNGANIAQWDYWEGENQQFALEAVGDNGDDEGDEVSVTDFGAQSGVQTCQVEAFHAAMDHFYEQGEEGTVYVPAGEYYLASPLQLRPGVNLVGEGMKESLLWSDDSSSYLVYDALGQEMNLKITDLGFSNQERLLLLDNVANMEFERVSFRDGIVRFEESNSVLINECHFENNKGKAAYASDIADNMTLTNNDIINPEQGGINLSRHNDSYVAHNQVESDSQIDSGYAGIRLPNNAEGNIVEDNTVIRTGRGLFVLSGSTGNTLRNNEVYSTTYQGALIESPDNTFTNNVIADAGEESIYVSQTSDNTVENNEIYDTEAHSGDRFIGLEVTGENNSILQNIVYGDYGRDFKEIAPGNIDRGNEYR